MITWWKTNKLITTVYNLENVDKPKENIQFGIFYDSNTSMIKGRLMIERLQHILTLESDGQYVYQVPYFYTIPMVKLEKKIESF